VLALVAIVIAVFAVCVIPFLVSCLLAVQDITRGRYRLTKRICTVAATLTVMYSLAICVFQSPLTISTPDELIHWVAVIGMWDLALMFCVSVFSLLGYLAGSKWGRARVGAFADSEVPLCELQAVATEETGNPYQIPRG
jgi:hypothetical protein